VEVQIDEDVILKTHITGLEPDSVTWVKHQSQLEINDKEYVSIFRNLIKVSKRGLKSLKRWKVQLWSKRT
jgi:hypothetical protein